MWRRLLIPRLWADHDEVREGVEINYLISTWANMRRMDSEWFRMEVLAAKKEQHTASTTKRGDNTSSYITFVRRSTGRSVHRVEYSIGIISLP